MNAATAFSGVLHAALIKCAPHSAQTRRVKIDGHVKPLESLKMTRLKTSHHGFVLAGLNEAGSLHQRQDSIAPKIERT
ncbi:MAG: hypothetical protein LBL95_01425 [Deltaproteobacteria bacterium]|jgi:hypothetical protein|nr:hypothetical protein [Deltaproteobacteria bacterium]